MDKQENKPRRRPWLLLELMLILVLTGLAMLLMPALSGVANEKTRTVPAGFDIVQDVEYARVGGHPLVLDIYDPRPPDSEPRPVAVFIHGGAWRGGDKRGGAIYLRQLVEAGYLCFSVNYRLSGQAKYPAQIHDCKAAVRWIRKHCEQYGGDPGRIAALGPSAGGHLVALLAMSNGDPTLEGTVGDCLDESSAVQVVADWFGPSDLVKMGDAEIHDWHRDILEDLFGQPLEEIPGVLAEASPALHVDAADVPVIIIHGTADDTVPVEQSRHFNAVLAAAGVDVEYVEVEGGKHGHFRGCDPDHWELIDLMIAFFDEHLE